MMTTRQQRTEDRPVNQADSSGNVAPEQDWRRTTTVAHDTIARSAYELYERRGRESGHDLEDWLQAEREVHERQFKE